MGIALEEPREVLPSVRLPNVGDYVTGHLIHLDMRDEIDVDTKQVKLNDAGKPKKVQIVSIMITDASDGALIGSGDDLRQPMSGDEARIFVQGGTWKWWIEAKSSIQLEVGDVLRWKFESVTPNPNKRHSDFKDRKFMIRKPRPEEADGVAHCEGRYREIVAAAANPFDNIVLSTDDDF
jgi:hypothetical protein